MGTYSPFLPSSAKVGSAHLHQCGITIPPKKRRSRRRRGERHDFVSIFSCCCRRWTCFSPQKRASNIAVWGSSVPSKKKRKFSVYKELRGDDDDDNDDNDGEKDMDKDAWGGEGESGACTIGEAFACCQECCHADTQEVLLRCMNERMMTRTNVLILQPLVSWHSICPSKSGCYPLNCLLR
jgi:hypothetical protein